MNFFLLITCFTAQKQLLISYTPTGDLTNLFLEIIQKMTIDPTKEKLFFHNTGLLNYKNCFRFKQSE